MSCHSIPIFVKFTNNLNLRLFAIVEDNTATEWSMKGIYTPCVTLHRGVNFHKDVIYSWRFPSSSLLWKIRISGKDRKEEGIRISSTEDGENRLIACWVINFDSSFILVLTEVELLYSRKENSSAVFAWLNKVFKSPEKLIGTREI